MTYEFFGHTYTLLNPAGLWPLVFLPLLWLPLFWLRRRMALLSAALLLRRAFAMTPLGT
jgi:hypothetical protein